jgi:hypothetical protein
MSDKAIEVLLDEKRNFLPQSAHGKSASVFNSARKNPQAFWAQAAKELEWFKPGKTFWNGIRHGPHGSSGEKSRPPTTVWTGMSKG